jgi:hypothetical protein
VQVCAPLAFQLKVTGSPVFTLLALTCKEIDGLATAGVAAAASPLPAGVRESPSQAANDEIVANAKSQRAAAATIRRVCVVPLPRRFERVSAVETRMDSGLRPTELIRVSLAAIQKSRETLFGSSHLS